MGNNSTKAGKGITFSDVANSGVRNILSEISKRYFKTVDDSYFDKMRSFFNNKCPYTGKDLFDLEKQEKLTTDHIVSQNREGCGLNVLGNLVLCDKEANSKKKKYSLEEFLLDDKTGFFNGVSFEVRQKRYERIKEFQNIYNYDGSEVKTLISDKLESIYQKIKNQQERYIDEIASLLKQANAISSTYKYIPSENRKIGDIIRHEFFDLLRNGKVSKEEIERLQSTEYSNQTFGISSHPVLSKTPIDAKGLRTYSTPIKIYGTDYYVCNDWHEKSRDKLVDYINRYY